MSDPLDELRGLAPPVDDQPGLLEHVRNDLMAIIDSEAPMGPAQVDELESRRAKRRWVVPVAAVLVATTAAATFALTRTSADTTSLQCPTNESDGVSIIDAVTGDPVVDCSNVWRRDEKTEPPAMRAYDSGAGGVVVLLADEPAPDGYAAIEPGPHQGDALIELEASLAASGTGLPSGCYDESKGREIVQSELDRLELGEWTIAVDSARLPDGTTRCAYFVTKPEDKEVQLIGFDVDAVAADPFADFADELNERLNAECVGIDEATTLAQALADSTVIEDNGVIIELAKAAEISAVEDPSAECTRATVDVTGAVYVTLRGPKG